MVQSSVQSQTADSPHSENPANSSGEVVSESRYCIRCDEAIPAIRLAAKPNARFCVPCLEAVGDEPPIRRYDESNSDGTVESTYYVHNPYIESALNRINAVPASDEAFAVAVGDDSLLLRKRNEIVASADSLATEFESEDEAEQELPIPSDKHKRRMSADGVEKIRAAQLRRWKKYREEKEQGRTQPLSAPLPVEVNAHAV